MELEISGIKCDTNHCNYRDDDVKFSEYPQWIDKPCPMCSGNLLTQADYNSCLKMYKVVRVFNILKWINPFFYLGRLYRLIFKKDKYDNLEIKYENDGSETQRSYTTEK